MRERVRTALRWAIYRYGWTTRSRHASVARELRRLREETGGSDLLDVGCGPAGVAAFLSGFSTVGLDIEAPQDPLPPSMTFRKGSITDMPFENHAFPLVSCVDVLEHLPVDARERALDELVRVAGDGLVLACPHGTPASDADAAFHDALARRSKPIPDWLLEHQAQPYPEPGWLAARLEDAARRSGRRLQLQISYCEPIAVCRALRLVAARSAVLNVGLDLVLGPLTPLLRARSAARSYRVVLVARFAAAS